MDLFTLAFNLGGGWHRAGRDDDPRNGGALDDWRLAEARSVLARDVQPGRLVRCVGGGRMCISVCFFLFIWQRGWRMCRGDTATEAGTVGGSRRRVCGERIYNDFSFFALGESAPWEFTPLTPLAKKRGGHIQISFSLSSSRRALSCFAARKQAHAGMAALVAHLCLSLIGSWKEPVSFSGSELGCAPSTGAAES